MQKLEMLFTKCNKKTNATFRRRHTKTQYDAGFGDEIDNAQFDIAIL
jgi:hypothetical protein